VTPATLQRRYTAGPLVAYHEAGHALIAHRLGRKVRRVVVGHARDSGQTDIVPTWDLHDAAMIFLAGEVAERFSISWLDGFDDLHQGSEDRMGAAAALVDLGGCCTVADLFGEVAERLRRDQARLRDLAVLLDRERVLDGQLVAAMLG
jgi:hypothetical protein